MQRSVPLMSYSFAMLIAAFTMALPAYAEQEIESDAGEVVIDATVNEIDEETQSLTVVGPGGNVIVVKAPPEILRKVKVKERITIRYTDMVATALRPAEGPPQVQGNNIEAEETADMDMNPATVSEQSWVQAEPSGGVGELDTIEVTATIAQINRHKRIVTFNGPNGQPRAIMVNPSVDLTGVEVGDRVVVLLTRAVAIDVKPI